MIKGLHFFGCSFTSLEDSPTPHLFVNHRKLISEELQIPQTSHAFQGKSNSHIINDVYLCSKENMNKDTVFIIQYTFFNRMGLYSEVSGDKFVSVCKKNIDDSCDFAMEVEINFYNNWLKYFYSRKNSILEFEKQVDTISAWLKCNDIKFISYGYDLDMNEFSEDFYIRNNFLKFENNYSLYQTSIDKRLRIIDCGNPQEFNDNHLSSDGHLFLKNILVKEIKKIMDS